MRSRSWLAQHSEGWRLIHSLRMGALVEQWKARLRLSTEEEALGNCGDGGTNLCLGGPRGSTAARGDSALCMGLWDEPLV